MSYLGLVRRVGIENLRGIRQGRLDGICGSVLAFGPNGSGKTTLLEAIYLISRGRSFRSSKSGPLISKGERRARIEVFGEGADGEPIRSEFTTPGDRSQAGLGVGRLNVRLVGENSQVLLEGDPSLRRRFLDLNVFHVEPGFSGLRARFERALAQRNAWLRNGARGSPVWDGPYVAASEAFTLARERFLARWNSSVSAVGQELPGKSTVSLGWFRGWASAVPLGDVLDRSLESDRQLGFTRSGPMRADFWMELDGERARLSRGQAKCMVAVLQLAAREVEQGSGGRPAVWLLDDLSGELDPEAAQWALSRFLASGDQCFMTAIASRASDGLRQAPGFTDVFHVEQGVIQRI